MSADATPLENQVFARVGKLLHKYLKTRCKNFARFQRVYTSGDGLLIRKFTVGIRSIVGKNTMTKEDFQTYGILSIKTVVQLTYGVLQNHLRT